RPNLTIISKDYSYIKTYRDTTLGKVEFLELYDRKIDTLEMKNKAYLDQYAPIVEEMDSRIQGFKKEYP
ncbi:MAG: hypothetical protein AAFX53_05830, partial [Bacteroidota bacterium]